MRRLGVRPAHVGSLARVTELAALPLSRLRTMLDQGDLSPVELVESARRAFERWNGRLNAIVTPTFDRAIADATRAARTGERGPLYGIPLAVKDSVDTAGVRTTHGSPLFRDRVPNADSLHVLRLRRAGALLVGKTNTPELEAGINTRNPLFGQTLNPWDVTRGAGGSSGGSAVAVATGMCVLADGTDHGGSVRIPAALNGVVGFRPSPGRVPLHPTPWVYDPFSVPGPLARSVRDAAFMLSLMAGPDPRIPISLADAPAGLVDPGSDVRGLRVAWTRDLGGLFPVDTEVAAAVERAARRFADLGAAVEEHAPDWRDAPSIIRSERAFRTAVVTEQLGERVGEIANPLLRDYLGVAGRMTLSEVGRAEALRSRYWERTAAFFEQWDLLVLPATAWTAFPSPSDFPASVAGRAVESAVDAILATYAVTVAGLPALSVPCGRSADGLPIGLQIVGGWRRDAEVLRAGAAFEDAFGWTGWEPAIAARW